MTLGLSLLRRQSLRMRFSLAFVALSTSLAVALALTTFVIVRSFLERQRIAAATRQTAFAVLYAREFLEHRPDQDRALVRALRTREAYDAMLVAGENELSTSLSLSSSDLPSSLARLIDQGRVAYQIQRIEGVRTLIFGAPVRGDTQLYLFYPLDDVDRMMSLLGTVLALGCAGVAVVGVAGARQLTRRILRPLTAVTAAAHRIAEGLLETRVDAISEDEVGTLAASFNEMAERVRVMIERERRFVAALAHELRTPLAGLQTTSELLRAHRDEVPPAAREAVDLVAEDVTDLRQLIEDLMEVSALDAGSASVRFEDVDLRALVEAQAAKRRRDVAVRGPRVVVSTDKARLARIVANLLDNAYEHGGGEVTVVVADDDGASAAITVSDRGPGVSDADRARIFDAFYKADRSRTRGRGGVGLGLSIALANARLLGGTIDLATPATGGASFTVRLPDRRREDDAG